MKRKFLVVTAMFFWAWLFLFTSSALAYSTDSMGGVSVSDNMPWIIGGALVIGVLIMAAVKIVRSRGNNRANNLETAGFNDNSSISQASSQSAQAPSPMETVNPVAQHPGSISGVKVCHMCGKGNLPGAVFCDICGHKI
ncbi:zinc ribbon domain-containing protein [Patescibacteria group bacterium]|nr:MAG: zinc ribbon domain-containing protein [Patescibacteria group bacterium]